MSDNSSQRDERFNAPKILHSNSLQSNDDSMNSGRLGGVTNQLGIGPISRFDKHGTSESSGQDKHSKGSGGSNSSNKSIT